MTDWKFQQIHPAPARTPFREEMWTAKGWTAQEKLDGHRAVLQICTGGIVRFTSRRISKVTGKLVENTDLLPHLRIGLPKSLAGTVLDGELVVAEGSDSMKVSSIMGSLPERAIALQKKQGWLRFAVFDCLFLHGKDLRAKPLRDRRSHMATVLAQLRHRHIIQVSGEDLPVNRQKYCQQIQARGGEGVILKSLSAAYGEQWAKVKRFASYDVVIMGFQEAAESSVKKGGTKETRTKYAGMVGAIVFGQYVGRRLTEFGTCSGFTDAWRKEFTKHENTNKYVGRVIRITAQERLESGAFRHPVFDADDLENWRDDKDRLACIYRQGES